MNTFYLYMTLWMGFITFSLLACSIMIRSVGKTSMNLCDYCYYRQELSYYSRVKDKESLEELKSLDIKPCECCFKVFTETNKSYKTFIELESNEKEGFKNNQELEEKTKE